MKLKVTICHYAKNTARGCKECGTLSDVGKPCHMKIPDYIPDEQISRFVLNRERSWDICTEVI